MINLNKVFLAGNIASDIELATTNSGYNVAKFTLATNETFKSKNGEKKQNATFHNIVVWNKLAETIKTYCSKGDNLYLEGKITSRSYEDKNKVKRYITEIVVSNFQFGQKKKETLKEIDEADNQEMPVDDIDLNDIPV